MGRADLLRRDVGADVDPGAKLDSLCAQQLEAALEESLLHLEFRNAVAQQTADAVGLLEDGDRMAGAVELVGGGQPGRPRTDDGNGLAGPAGRGPGRDPALFERPLDDRELDRLDRDRVPIDGQHARALARSWAQAPGPLREVVGLVETRDRVAPLSPIDQVVPVGN